MSREGDGAAIRGQSVIMRDPGVESSPRQEKHLVFVLSRTEAIKV